VGDATPVAAADLTFTLSPAALAPAPALVPPLEPAAVAAAAASAFFLRTSASNFCNRAFSAAKSGVSTFFFFGGPSLPLLLGPGSDVTGLGSVGVPACEAFAVDIGLSGLGFLLVSAVAAAALPTVEFSG